MIYIYIYKFPQKIKKKQLLRTRENRFTIERYNTVTTNTNATALSYVSFFGDVLKFFAPRTYDNKKTYIRGWDDGWNIGEKL